jgi:hypothetical protein
MNERMVILYSYVWTLYYNADILKGADHLLITILYDLKMKWNSCFYK